MHILNNFLAKFPAVNGGKCAEPNTPAKASTTTPMDRMEKDGAGQSEKQFARPKQLPQAPQRPESQRGKDKRTDHAAAKAKQTTSKKGRSAYSASQTTPFSASFFGFSHSGDNGHSSCSNSYGGGDSGCSGGD